MTDLNIPSFNKIVIVLGYGRVEPWTDSLWGAKEDYKDFGTVLSSKLKVKMNHRNIGWSGPSAATSSHYSSPSATITELLVIPLTYLRNECGSITIVLLPQKPLLMNRLLSVFQVEFCFAFKFLLFSEIHGYVQFQYGISSQNFSHLTKDKNEVTGLLLFIASSQLFMTI